jgi:hypothetical protein
MSSPRYLTKSRFKLAAECPTKLFYTGKPQLYRNLKQEDSFLAMLADGGYQVGELAKCFYPTGIEISFPNNAEAEAQTLEWLKQDKVVLFEPAIRFENLFVRADILVKDGNHFQLIEVKAKSYNSSNPQIVGANGDLLSGMRPYIEDVAFQAHVLRSALQTLCPGAQVRSYLMMPDKSVKAAVSGLNQLFKIERANGRAKVVFSSTSSPLAKQLASTPGHLPLLALVPVDEYVDKVMQDGVRYMSFKAPLPQLATEWAEAYKHDRKIDPTPGKHCGKCEFKTRPQDGLLSGFEECWQQTYGLSPSQLAEGTVLDIYNFRRKDQLISDGTVLLSKAGGAIEIVDARPELSLSERQWMQVKGIPPEEDRGGFWMADEVMRQEMRTWQYPYHFIDFETSTVAIPFHAGMRPYEAVAFQFSHHVMQADGSVAHVGEFLMTDPVVFPNFEFARALKAELEGDGGTVFMWSPHENTILNKVAGQLAECLEGGAPDDALELIEFVRTLTTGGSRAMVDLCALSKRAYFAEGIKGSSSIKKVLPSVMKWSGELKRLYSGEVYGAVAAEGQDVVAKQAAIPSKNFKNFALWVPSASDPSVPLEPYDLLRLESEDLLGEGLMAGEDPDVLAITEGGAAATAYARLQFEDVDEVERRMIREALLRYCELDTLAMVMIVQGWQEAVGEMGAVKQLGSDQH